MALVTPSYAGASPTAITISLASLATSSTFVAGQECTQIDNTTNKYVHAFVRGSVMVGTGPTADRAINVYVWGSQVSLATTPIDVLDGTDSAETISNVGILSSALRLARNAIVSATTSDLAYPIRIFEVATALGLPALPPFWGIFVAHNTGVNLNATGSNHSFDFMGVKYDIT